MPPPRGSAARRGAGAPAALATLGGNPAASVAWLGMAVIMFLGLPMWLFALFGGSLAFAIADILCDIVISEGDTHEVGSAEDSDAEEGVEMAAIATPRRDASKAFKPGYAPVANQSTPAPPSRSEPSPVKPSYLADGQSADASLSGTQVRVWVRVRVRVRVEG